MNAIASVLLLVSTISIAAFPSDSLVNVNDMGVYGDGKTELSDALQEILDKHVNIYLPPGKYLIDKSLYLRSHHQIVGTDSTVLMPTANASASGRFFFFTVCGAQHVRLEKITFYTEDIPERLVIAVLAQNVQHLILTHLNAFNCGVARILQPNEYSYSAIPNDLTSRAFDRVGNSDIGISYCRGEGSQRTMAQYTAGVLLGFTRDWTISNCSFSRYDHGVQWWGGDSNPERDGKVANVRKCQNGLISDVTIKYVRGGGIWGSMGEDITVQNSHVMHCGDVGIDFEGCFRSKAINNYVAESNNGNIAVFHHNQDILFANNQLVQSDPKRPQACIYNASQSQDNGQVTFDNNVFINTKGVGHIKQQGPSSHIIFTQNSLHNVVANFSFNNNKYIDISENIFLVTRLLVYDYVLKAGQTHHGGKVSLEKNHFISTVPQSESVYAISLHQSDYNSSPINRVINNTIVGLPYQMKVVWAGGNAGFAAETYIESEHLLSPEAIQRVEAGARSSELYVNDKRWMQ